MENFKHRNKEIKFWSVTGEILGQNKYSETHVSSSGGGGYVGQHGGHVSAPTVHSTTVTNHEFWIKKEDGSEKSIQLAGHDIPLREGQKITLISAGIKGKDSGYFSVLVNHNANQHWFVNKADSLNKLLKIDQISGKSIFIAGGLWWLVTSITNSVGTGAIITGAFVVYRIATKIPRIIKMIKALNKHLESIAQQAYQNT
ncbi:hypothetical protein [Vibrio ziniensis]|uniref:Uncharacterized protein n=1 Tax=Vibrio ziniensis TaxID=2711221 RepID=A0A6G7CNB6_9VIBR|nr:hypothetical protein [Vibrio ziniensis]QIH43564.1 hypothetical protein G5S32_16350 [Vibrio ziniensis]